MAGALCTSEGVKKRKKRHQKNIKGTPHKRKLIKQFGVFSFVLKKVASQGGRKEKKVEGGSIKKESHTLLLPLRLKEDHGMKERNSLREGKKTAILPVCHTGKGVFLFLFSRG